MLTAGESHSKSDVAQQELLAHAAPGLRVEGGLVVENTFGKE